MPTNKNNQSNSNMIPLRFGNDPMLMACWLYYEEGMTQSDIAKSIGVSRASVNTYLADARKRGIVNISIDAEKLSAISVAYALKTHFGLQECLVIPTEGGKRTLIERLGTAGAMALSSFLQPGDSIAVGWGRTMLAVAQAIKKSELQDMQVIQATGSTSIHEEYSPVACASLFARALGTSYTTIAAPAVVSSSEIRKILVQEDVISSQISKLDNLNRVIFGVASLRPNSSIYSSDYLDLETKSSPEKYTAAVGAIAGRFIDDMGHPIAGPLDERTIGITLDQLLKTEQRIAVAGGYEKVPALLASIRGGFANVLVTDVATARGILMAEGQDDLLRRSGPSEKAERDPIHRSHVKKFINKPANAVKESLEGAIEEYKKYLEPIGDSIRALRSKEAPRANKVGLVIGGGAGHEPCFLGYVGQGMADAVAIGNVFASPPPGPILDCTIAADQGAGVLYILGNYSGDILNFEMAAELANNKGITVKSVITTDDIASSSLENKKRRRGVAGNIFVFKVAGAACDQMYSLEKCAEIAMHANQMTYTVGIALEPCSLPDTRRPSFILGENEMEVGVGVHGEPGVERQRMGTADEAADLMIEKILDEMKAEKGARVALLVNSLGGTPLMELHIINRRIRSRLTTRGIIVHVSWTGHYCTSLDMVGVSVSVMHLDDQLQTLLDSPSSTPAFTVG
jgi:phosphoenolpyruvate---glycerone phosphotransferase subunit DhaK